MSATTADALDESIDALHRALSEGEENRPPHSTAAAFETAATTTATGLNSTAATRICGLPIPSVGGSTGITGITPPAQMLPATGTPTAAATGTGTVSGSAANGSGSAPAPEPIAFDERFLVPPTATTATAATGSTGTVAINSGSESGIDPVPSEVVHEPPVPGVTEFPTTDKPSAAGGVDPNAPLPGVKALNDSDAVHYGKQTIGLFASICLTVNNITGPGMLAFPLIYVKAGFIWPTICIIVFACFSAIASTMIVDAMLSVPGNSRFQRRMEYTTLVQHYYNERWHVVAQIFLNVSTLTKNIASIIITAQVMDEIIVYAFGSSFALQMFPFNFVTTVHRDTGMLFSEDSGIVLTAGYLVVMFMCAPMGLLNMDDNMTMQVFSSIVLVLVTGCFGYQFGARGLHVSTLPLVGSESGTIAGVIMFSFSCVVPVPSWANEKKTDVSTTQTIWISTAIATAMYIFYGICGAMAYPHLNSSNILSVMAHGDPADTPMIVRISVYIFSISVIGFGIPLFAVVMRYNLYLGGMCSHGWSLFWSAVFPWCFSFALYQGSAFFAFVNWSSLFSTGIINFIVPALLYLKARERYGLPKGVLPEPDPNASPADGGAAVGAAGSGSTAVGAFAAAADERRGSAGSGGIETRYGPDDELSRDDPSDPSGAAASEHEPILRRKSNSSAANTHTNAASRSAASAVDVATANAVSAIAVAVASAAAGGITITPSGAISAAAASEAASGGGGGGGPKASGGDSGSRRASATGGGADPSGLASPRSKRSSVVSSTGSTSAGTHMVLPEDADERSTFICHCHSYHRFVPWFMIAIISVTSLVTFCWEIADAAMGRVSEFD